MTLKEWSESNIKTNIELCFMDRIGSINKELAKMLKSQVFPSKRIRSYLLYVLCKDLINEKDYYHIAVGMELFQQATLIYDDVIDASETRDGGRIALHNRLGNTIGSSGKADHIASILMLLAEKEMLNISNCEIINEFNNIRIKMFKAQLIDVFLIKKPIKTKYMNWLLKESYKKTSEFMGFPFSVYNAYSFKKDSTLIKFRQLGKDLGVLYQIGDDLFDIEDGVKPGTLSLTFPLAYLLDKKDLSVKNKIFIQKLIKSEYINKENAKILTEIYVKNKEDILISAKKHFKSYKKKIDVELDSNESIKVIVQDLLNIVLNKSYWEYKIV